MSPKLLKLSFLLVFVGFGAKTGFVPMHTWLPDAHSQAPTPICAVLSGIKTSVPLYVILRFLSIILASPEARMGRWMIVIGLFSVGIAAFLLLQVRDYKRMFAYSTIEHMGIISDGSRLRHPAISFRRYRSDAEPFPHKVSLFLYRGYSVGCSRNAADKGRARTFPALAFCGRSPALSVR